MKNSPSRQCLLALITCLFFIPVAQAQLCFGVPLPANPDYHYDDSLLVQSPDGTAIAANVFTPSATAPAAGYPAIIFVNSWVLDEHEYLVQAAKLARKGYVVLSYSARGWGCSGGEVSVLSDGDMLDLTAVVDYLAARGDVDMANIGISGISYGSGISLKGLALEPRIKTAVAMSSWGNLGEALYGNETPRLFWGSFLTLSGLITANLSDEVPNNYADLLAHRNIEQVLAWANHRSPMTFINLINERRAPVYIANNFGDNLFQPNNILAFFAALTGPKRMDLNQGTHASAEGFGLIGLENETWDNTLDWFDYWLKGEATGIMQKPVVNLRTDLQYAAEGYSQWPPAQSSERTFYLGRRGLIGQGSLRDSPYKPWWPNSDSILSGIDSGASTGIPAVSALLDGHTGIPVLWPLGLTNRVNGIVFQTERQLWPMKIRGNPRLSLELTPSYSRMQLVAYLYDVDAWGMGKLITHAPVTLHSAKAGKRQTVEFELVATAYDLPAGHKLAVALDTFDLLYAVPTLVPYSVTFNYSSAYQSTLVVPVL
ncbi:CocE/NonD family hydrolase [Simiduia agarivorans]|uniref:Acyl esterase n=1 Tax=Simiduia agarivorans (strain DSM 21679 / JCM 13881 / BCRC 17597 / SA1) TaxID=1117647 RepID=K4KNP5_SIMAS|nr:CocE/NonD family hydrolase [Simiduia agarivorans]AFV00790.1 acyl esterase [Simiduia agarivorans SA1 = DSM 21679]